MRRHALVFAWSFGLHVVLAGALTLGAPPTRAMTADNPSWPTHRESHIAIELLAPTERPTDEHHDGQRPGIEAMEVTASQPAIRGPADNADPHVTRFIGRDDHGVEVIAGSYEAPEGAVASSFAPWGRATARGDSAITAAANEPRAEEQRRDTSGHRGLLGDAEEGRG